RDGRDRRLELTHHALGPGEVVDAALDHLDRQRPVGAGRHGDLIAPRRVDNDQCRAGGGPVRHAHARDPDPLLLECRAEPVPGSVVTDAGEEAHLGAQAPRRDGLVGALAAVAHEERPTADRLAGARQVPRGDGEVDVRRADYEEARRRGEGGHRRSRNRRRKRSASMRFAIRQFGSPLARSVSPSGPMTRRTDSHAASVGSIASASARGSWSTSPCDPLAWSIRKPRSLNATMRSASGPDTRRNADFMPARGRPACRVASGGRRCKGSRAASTRWAASGSTYMLNSAVGVTLPGTSTAPPIAMIRPIRLTAPASALSVRARLVS